MTEAPTLDQKKAAIAEFMGLNSELSPTGWQPYDTNLQWLYPVWQKLKAMHDDPAVYTSPYWSEFCNKTTDITTTFRLAMPVSDIFNAIYKAVEWLNENTPKTPSKAFNNEIHIRRNSNLHRRRS